MDYLLGKGKAKRNNLTLATNCDIKRTEDESAEAWSYLCDSVSNIRASALMLVHARREAYSGDITVGNDLDAIHIARHGANCLNAEFEDDDQ